MLAICKKFKKRYDRECQLWLMALSFLTRIPVTLSSNYCASMLTQSSRYFGVIGCLIGVINAGVFLLLAAILPLSIAVLVTMAVNLLLTGAFHEDGWADVFDGFGGGWQVNDKLAIMKDSRLGTYGAAALFIMLFIKYQALVHIQVPWLIAVSLIVAHSLSRVVATSIIYSMNYVSEDSLSKVKPVAQSLSLLSLFVLLLTGFIGLFFIWFFIDFSFIAILSLVGVLWLVRQLLIYWFNTQLNGYTGDCLGAAQQASEVMVYLTLVVLCTQELALVKVIN